RLAYGVGCNQSVEIFLPNLLAFDPVLLRFRSGCDLKEAGMKLPQTGGCQCGAIRHEITEEPALVYTCHCTDCQRLTSSAFSIGIVVQERAFRLSGVEPRPLQRIADSGRANIRLVCPDCGSWICGLPRDGMHRVRAGTMDDTSWR